MNIKNTVELTISEAVELLAKIADSLEHEGEFAFDLKGQEVSIEVGENLIAQLSISPDEFSMIFNWGQEQETSAEDTKEVTTEKQDYEQPPKMVQEVKVDEKQVQKPQEKSTPPVQSVPQRALPDRMQLNTTTLPLEGGYWEPAFTNNAEAEWTPVNVEGELENKKWASEDQITTLSDLTPSSAKPKKSRPQKSQDDDLFSELDKLDEPSKPKAASSKEQVEKVEIPDNRSAKPAASVSSIPQPKADANRKSSVPSSAPSTQMSQPPSPSSQPPSSPSSSSKNRSSPPSSPPSPKSTSTPPSPKSRSSIPKPSSKPQPRKQSDEDWQEPKPEENATKDDWVRPSEVLQKQNVPKSSEPTQSMSSKETSSKSSKRSTIPKPSEATTSQTQSQPKDDMVNEVREWKEPSAEDNTTDDDWVKPSEFLKQSEKQSQKSSEAEDKEEIVDRPPPQAPDANDKDKKKKGWASWD